MKLGIVLGYSGADMSLPFDRVLEAERLGFDSIWTSDVRPLQANHAVGDLLFQSELCNRPKRW
jgi:hypothetical protein